MAQRFVYRVYLTDLLIRVDTVQRDNLRVVPLHLRNLVLRLLKRALLWYEGIVAMLEYQLLEVVLRVRALLARDLLFGRGLNLLNVLFRRVSRFWLVVVVFRRLFRCDVEQVVDIDADVQIVVLIAHLGHRGDDVAGLRCRVERSRALEQGNGLSHHQLGHGLAAVFECFLSVLGVDGHVRDEVAVCLLVEWRPSERGLLVDFAHQRGLMVERQRVHYSFHIWLRLLNSMKLIEEGLRKRQELLPVVVLCVLRGLREELSKLAAGLGELQLSVGVVLQRLLQGLGQATVAPHLVLKRFHISEWEFCASASNHESESLFPCEPVKQAFQRHQAHEVGALGVPVPADLHIRKLSARLHELLMERLDLGSELLASDLLAFPVGEDIASYSPVEARGLGACNVDRDICQLANLLPVHGERSFQNHNGPRLYVDGVDLGNVRIHYFHVDRFSVFQIGKALIYVLVVHRHRVVPVDHTPYASLFQLLRLLFFKQIDWKYGDVVGVLLLKVFRKYRLSRPRSACYRDHDRLFALHFLANSVQKQCVLL